MSKIANKTTKTIKKKTKNPKKRVSTGAILSKYTGPDNFEQLPDEILLHIFSFIDVRSIDYNVSSVCGRFSYLLKDNLYWKYICNVECHIMDKPRDKTWKETLYKNYCKHFLSLDYKSI